MSDKALPKVETNGMWIFPDRICIEPRKADGSLDVERIGTDLANELGRITDGNDLASVFFKHHPGVGSTSCQMIADWLRDNGFTWRERYW